MANEAVEAINTVLAEIRAQRRTQRAEAAEAARQAAEAAREEALSERREAFTSRLRDDFSEGLLDALQVEVGYNEADDTADEESYYAGFVAVLYTDEQFFRLTTARYYGDRMWLLIGAHGYKASIGAHSLGRHTQSGDAWLLDAIDAYDEYEASRNDARERRAAEPAAAPEPAPTRPRYASLALVLTSHEPMQITVLSGPDGVYTYDHAIILDVNKWALLVDVGGGNLRILPLARVDCIAPEVE